jgi:hypothetical protein
MLVAGKQGPVPGKQLAVLYAGAAVIHVDGLRHNGGGLLLPQPLT